jgi:hypothetical protein
MISGSGHCDALLASEVGLGLAEPDALDGEEILSCGCRAIRENTPRSPIKEFL